MQSVFVALQGLKDKTDPASWDEEVRALRACLCACVRTCACVCVRPCERVLGWLSVRVRVSICVEHMCTPSCV